MIKWIGMAALLVLSAPFQAAKVYFRNPERASER